VGQVLVEHVLVEQFELYELDDPTLKVDRIFFTSVLPHFVHWRFIFSEVTPTSISNLF